MIKFTIIVPLYNCEKYIGECLDSILAQTYENFEVVVVNDGSTDSSVDIVKSYADSRIKLYSQENKGLFHARLSGLRVATNDVCLYVDADDKIEDNLLEMLVPEFEGNATCVVYGLKCFGANNNSQIMSTKSERLTLDDKEPLRLLLKGETIQSIVCKAFLKNLVDIDKLEKYPRISIGEDAMHTLEVYSNTLKTIFIGKTPYLYRQNPGSMTHKLKFSNYIDNVYKVKKYIEVAKQIFGEDEADEILKDLPRRFFRLVIGLLINPRYSATSSEYKQVVDAISSDEFFVRMCNEHLNKCNVAYKFFLKRIKKKNYLILKMARAILKLLGK